MAETKKRETYEAHQLGQLSRRFESHGSASISRGKLADGRPDDGGISYGLFQMTSQTTVRDPKTHKITRIEHGGTAAAFLKHEGKEWAKEFGANKPGSEEFGKVWTAVATKDPERFEKAQEGYIQRTHYEPYAKRFEEITKVDLRDRSLGMQQAAFSCAVQQGPNDERVANRIVDKATRLGVTCDKMTDRQLCDAMYDARERIQGRASVGSRFENERKAAHAQLPAEGNRDSRFQSDKAVQARDTLAGSSADGGALGEAGDRALDPAALATKTVVRAIVGGDEERGQKDPTRKKDERKRSPADWPGVVRGP